MDWGDDIAIQTNQYLRFQWPERTMDRPDSRLLDPFLNGTQALMAVLYIAKDCVANTWTWDPNGPQAVPE